MAPAGTNADVIRHQMAEIRSQLHQDMRGVVQVATTATDWRSYVRGRPWVAIGLAFTSGFLLVPRRSQPATLVVQPSAVDTGVSPAAVKPGRSTLMRKLLDTIGLIAARAGQTYAINYVEHLLANHQPGPRPDAVSRPAVPDPGMRSGGRGFAARG